MHMLIIRMDSCGLPDIHVLVSPCENLQCVNIPENLHLGRDLRCNHTTNNATIFPLPGRRPEEGNVIQVPEMKYGVGECL